MSDKVIRKCGSCSRRRFTINSNWNELPVSCASQWPESSTPRDDNPTATPETAWGALETHEWHGWPHMTYSPLQHICYTPKQLHSLSAFQNNVRAFLALSSLSTGTTERRSRFEIRGSIRIWSLQSASGTAYLFSERGIVKKVVVSASDLRSWEFRFAPVRAATSNSPYYKAASLLAFETEKFSRSSGATT